MRQMKDHVCPGLTRRVPTLGLLFSVLFQECVSNITVYMLLLKPSVCEEFRSLLLIVYSLIIPIPIYIYSLYLSLYLL